MLKSKRISSLKAMSVDGKSRQKSAGLRNPWYTGVALSQIYKSLYLGGGNSIFVLFSPQKLGKCSKLTNYFSTGLKPPTSLSSILMLHWCYFPQSIKQLEGNMKFWIASWYPRNLWVKRVQGSLVFYNNLFGYIYFGVAKWLNLPVLNTT